MQNALKAALVVFVLTIPATLAAQDIDAGIDAYHRGDFASALIEFKPLAEQGDAKAQSSLGYMYAAGQGVAQDFAAAAMWFREAAEQGSRSAQANLGALYGKGQGVPQDYAEAVKWTRMGANRGYAQAQSNLGQGYKNGRGVPYDYVQAHMWFSLAAVQGNGSAAKFRDELARRMTSEQISEAQKRTGEWRPLK